MNRLKKSEEHSLQRIFPTTTMPSQHRYLPESPPRRRGETVDPWEPSTALDWVTACSCT